MRRFETRRGDAEWDPAAQTALGHMLPQLGVGTWGSLPRAPVQGLRGHEGQGLVRK